MREILAKYLSTMILMGMEWHPAADDMGKVVEVWHRLLEGQITPEQLDRRLKLWITHESKFPKPANILHMKVSDYAPTLNTGQAAPAIDNPAGKLPLKPESVSSGEYAAEQIAKMREAM